MTVTIELRNLFAGLGSAFAQDGVVARQQVWHLIGMLLRKPGAAFNICEEESEGAGRESYRSFSLKDRL